MRPSFLNALLLSTMLSTFSPQNAFAFDKGFNQAWLNGKYGTQWVAGFSEAEFARMLDLTKNAGGTLLRFWLLEGFQSDALLWKNGNPTGLNPVFVTNLRKGLQLAKAKGVKLNLTLLDGNIATGKPPTKEHEYFWWNLLNEKYGVREDFIRNVWVPILKVLAEPANQGAVAQLDLVNEINAMVRKGHKLRFDGGWAQANRFVCGMRNARDGEGVSIPLTASVGWNNAADLIVNGSLYDGCVDFFDVHVYDDKGEIPICNELASYAYRKGKKVQLGEFGQSNTRQSDSIQSKATLAFLTNAKACGLDAALAWRLSEDEPGAYLAFEKNRKIRPAYEVLRRF